MSSEIKHSSKPVAGIGSCNSNSSETESDQYAVGYQKPPKSTQFKPGQSGNPKGRPKGIKNLATDLSEELNEKILVTESGRSIEVTKQRAVIKTILSKSLKGDARTINTLINLIALVEQSDQNKLLNVDALSEDDQQILSAFTQKVLDDSVSHTDNVSEHQGESK